ncbi:hypothetical protein INR49_020615 [Caranx melampygus]|nr:hypothetical protein INR49_020615 [Caranx melampygus]
MIVVTMVICRGDVSSRPLSPALSGVSLLRSSSASTHPSLTTPTPTPGPLLLDDGALTASPDEHLRIKWTKLDGEREKVVLVAQGGVVKVGQEYKSRVSVPSHPLSVGDASLIMVKLRASDAGLYRCEVMRGMEDTQDMVSLNISEFEPRDDTGDSSLTETGSVQTGR